MQNEQNTATGKKKTGRQAHLTETERKEHAKEYQKRWRANNRDKINEYHRRYYAKTHPIRRKKYESNEQRLAARRENYRNNPEKVMRSRLNTAINLLNRCGYINDADAERMRGQI